MPDHDPQLAVEAVREDVEALSAIERGSASEGERRAAEWIAAQLEEAGAREVELESFEFSTSFAPAQAAHAAAGITAAAIGGRVGAGLALATLVSLERDFSGRSQWLRKLLPQRTGTNVVARIPASGTTRRRLVLVAHHDAARTGYLWRSPLTRVAANRAARTGSAPSFTALPEAAFAAVTAGSILRGRVLRAAGAAALGVSCALMRDAARSEVVPGASDNATGVAALLALVERVAADPLPSTEVLVLGSGCEEAGMGGMGAWLREHRWKLDRAGTLVLGLDTLGAGEPAVVAGEGPVRTVRYREQDLALTERAAERRSLPRPLRTRIGGYTDPVLAVHAGIPAVSLVSLRDGFFTNYHLPTDTPDRVDWESVTGCTRLAAAVAEEWTGP